MGKFSAIAFIITITAPLSAVAYTQNDADACTPDAMRLCWNAIPDASRITQCLAQNKQKLSPACSNVFNRPRDASVDRERPVERITGLSIDRTKLDRQAAPMVAKMFAIGT